MVGPGDVRRPRSCGSPVVYTARTSFLVGDGFTYSFGANQNATGHWFMTYAGRPDAEHPPEWTLVLTVLAWLGGHSQYQEQLLAAAISTATVVVIGLASRRVASERAGLVAAGIAAVYAGLWLYEQPLFAETLLMLEIAVMILLAYRFRDRPSTGRAATLGLVCGTLALTRSEQILIWPLLLLPLILMVKKIGWRRRVGWLGLATILMLVVLVPWTIFNMGRFQRPVLLSFNFGYAMSQGSLAIRRSMAQIRDQTTPTRRAFPGDTGPGHVGYFDLRCPDWVRGGDESVANEVYLRNALSYTDHHLSRLPVVLVAREGRALGYWDPFQQVTLDANLYSPSVEFNELSYVSTAIRVMRLGLISYWLLLVPALCGIFVLRRRRIPIYPLLAFIATVVIAVATTYGEIRYRAAAEVSIVVLAAVGIDAIVPRKSSTPANQLSATEWRFDQGTSHVGDQDDSLGWKGSPPTRSAASSSPTWLAMVGLTLLVVGAAVGMKAASWAAAVPPPAYRGPPVTTLVVPSNGAKVEDRSGSRRGR